jgi:hypothetical protein
MLSDPRTMIPAKNAESAEGNLRVPHESMNGDGHSARRQFRQWHMQPLTDHPATFSDAPGSLYRRFFISGELGTLFSPHDARSDVMRLQGMLLTFIST